MLGGKKKGFSKKILELNPRSITANQVPAVVWVASIRPGLEEALQLESSLGFTIMHYHSSSMTGRSFVVTNPGNGWEWGGNDHTWHLSHHWWWHSPLQFFGYVVMLLMYYFGTPVGIFYQNSPYSMSELSNEEILSVAKMTYFSYSLVK